MKLSYLNALRALEATLRNGTFSAAAEEIGVTVAAVGQQVRALEDYLGIKLFDRTPSGVRPTPAARAVAFRLTIGFGRIEDVLDELRKERNPYKFTVTMSHFVLEHWLSQRLPGYFQICPDAELAMNTSEGYVDLFEGDVDMAIRFSPEPGPEYSFDYLFSGCFLPVCTPEFAARYNLSPETKDLSGVPLFRLHDMTSDPAWVTWDRLLKRHGLRKDDSGPLERTTGQGMATSGAGLMISGLTESFNDLKKGELVAPLGPAFVTPFSYGYRLVWPAGRSLRGPMRDFRSWLNEEVDRYLIDVWHVVGVKFDRNARPEP